MRGRRLIPLAVAVALLVPASPAAARKDPARTDTPRAERAIAWFRAHLGTTAWEGYCELAVEQSFGTRHRYANARSNWESGRGRQHRDWRRAPRGALVFWSTSADAHVAISLGDGTVLTTSGHGARIGRVPMTWFGRPLGWKRADWA